jgi:hypothetical protein
MKRSVAAGAGLLILLSGLAALIPFRPVLEVSALPQGPVLLASPMNRGETFVISYVHSVNRRPVDDTIRFEGDHLVIIESRFDAFGAGIPETTNEAGRLAFGPDGRVIYSLSRDVPEIRLFVGRVAGHVLTVNRRSTPLADLIEPGRAVLIRPRTYSLFELITKESRR